MNENNRIFVVINRINSVLLLSVLLLAAGGLIWTIFVQSQWKRNRSIEVQDKTEQGSAEKVKLRLSNIEQVYGAPVQFVRLETEPKGGKFSSGYYPEATRNIMFLTKGLKQAHWLFSKHNFLIKTVVQLRESEGYDRNNPTRAMYYEIIKEDSNNDGRLAEDDAVVIALSRTDGTGYVELNSGHQRIVGHRTVNQGAEVAVIVEKDGKVLYSTYSLRNFSKTAEIVITEIADKL
ncbi:MAG: hypothetical protein A2X56_06955 [Nitrospirae bacterium GWC2_57_13]|nr:MAG: hypothetical protein A2X56_06955 [Nitrospirae bacterium GWC2_57_13]